VSEIQADIDRREWPRSELEVTAEMVVRDRLYVSLSRNISCGGMFLLLKEAPPINELFTLKFSLPGTDRVLSVEAQVVWTCHRPANLPPSGKPTAVGVKFINLKGPDRTLILNYVNSRSKPPVP
jgi:Tfp pilus assembly protein PilZ